MGEQPRWMLDPGTFPEARPRGLTRVAATANSRRIPERVADAFQQVAVRLEEYVPEASAETVIDPAEPRVRFAREAVIQVVHAVREAARLGSEDEVEVVRHERPREHEPAFPLGDVCGLLDEEGSQRVVEDNLLAIAASDDVVVPTGNLDARRTRHVLTVRATCS